jgi:GntR family transcriptional regulator/MocR family aminotransferase
LRLIAWAEGKQDRYLLEDDYDSEFRLCGKPMQSLFCLRPDKVIYMNTFSKSLAPSMRMGYMVLPPELYERYLKLYGHTASVVPLFEQKTLCKMMESGAFERHINRMRTHYRGVREKLLKKLEGIVEPHEVQDTASGLHMTVLFPEAKSDEEVRAICARNGLKAALLTDYLLAPAEGFSKTAVLSYSDISDE